ncbi:MAG: galactokinase [Oscillospiraceae bacterium]|nr:galactokinase [Oscillospiraceae bacterium]
MQQISRILDDLKNGAYGNAFARLYAEKAENQAARYNDAIMQFEKLYGHKEARLFSAPGRTEVGGNHTDHQRGRVLAAAVNMDIICVAAPNDDGVIRIKSAGYEMDEVSVGDFSAKPGEENTAIALIRGVAARCAALGFLVCGFDAYTTSDVLKGSGLSSSAAFEVAVGVMISRLFNDGGISPVEIAKIGQFAENNYFGKPSGLMDQMASSVGGFITIDFADPEQPIISPVGFDFAPCGHSLCIVDTGGSHANLTGEYAAIPAEMKSIARELGAEFLREADYNAFYARIPELRKKCGDRAVLRAMHFFGDNNRVVKQADALSRGDFEGFKNLIIESGQSSLSMLQNIFACHAPDEQGVTLALAASGKILAGRGAWRVHGGGFAGTIQAFVPDVLLGGYIQAMEGIFGAGSCHRLSVRPIGGTEILK